MSRDYPLRLLKDKKDLLKVRATDLQNFILPVSGGLGGHEYGAKTRI